MLHIKVIILNCSCQGGGLLEIVIWFQMIWRTTVQTGCLHYKRSAHMDQEPLNVCFCSLYLTSKMIPQSVHSCFKNIPPPLSYLLERRWRYTAACMSPLHASAACHTGEHKVEEEWRQIKYQTIACILTHAGKLAYFDSFFNSLTVTALKFLNLPVECTRG